MRLAIAFALLLGGCEATPEEVPFESREVQVRWDPAGGDFWDLPFPSDLRFESKEDFGFMAWPGVEEINLVSMWFQAADRRLDAWGLNSGVTMITTGLIDEASLPADGPATDDASVFLIDIDPDSPERGHRMPIRPRWDPWGSKYAPGFALTAVPVYGHVRRPETTYALVITDALRDDEGQPVGRSRVFHDAFEDNEGADAALVDRLVPLRETLEAEGLDPEHVAGAAVFTTMDPSRDLRRLVDWSEAHVEPELTQPWAAGAEYESYQLLTARYGAPHIQTGARPYTEEGEGLINWGDDGDPEIRDWQDVRLALTLPKTPQPNGGFPLLLYLHGSGGNYLQAVERGPVDELTGSPLGWDGDGPAEWLARRGVATLGFDFALHGDRNDPPDTTGLKLYNLTGNIEATLDNFTVAPMEVTLISRLMLQTAVDSSLADTLDAGGAADGMIRFDPERLMGMGQSMGTTLGIPWSTVDPRVQAFIASGAGGILAELAITAIEPFELRLILAPQLGLDDPDELTEAHPMLQALQNLWDLVDPVAKGRHVQDEPFAGHQPVHVFMTAGVRDGYFHPRSEAAVAASLGLDQAGEQIEPILPEVLDWAGSDHLDYAVQGNKAGVTGVVVQYAAPNNLGHYVVFNQDGARHQYTCFAASVGNADSPKLDAPGSLDDPCP